MKLPSLLVILFALLTPTIGAEKLKLLLVDGQNNHKWQETSPLLKAIYEQSSRFEITVTTSPPAPPRSPRKPKTKDEDEIANWKKAMSQWVVDAEKLKMANAPKWAEWRPAFADYDVVVSNYNGEPWPKAVEKAFENYVESGGGFVCIHAADNSHPQWKAYNEMIAVGGWGGRNETSGPYLRLRKGKWTHDTTPGRGGAHGSKHEFVVETREPEHPIMKGLPSKWMHTADELYDRLRGPAVNVTVLASAFSEPSTNGSGEHEPILMVINYGKGRVFHTTLGHDTTSMSGLGFQASLLRGTEWAATGNVTFEPVEGLSETEAAVGPVRPQSVAAAP
ncbi:MAG: ThuA domain-containing protein [Verrucomicrobiota bacterium]